MKSSAFFKLEPAPQLPPRAIPLARVPAEHRQGSEQLPGIEPATEIKTAKK